MAGGIELKAGEDYTATVEWNAVTFVRIVGPRPLEYVEYGDRLWPSHSRLLVSHPHNEGMELSPMQMNLYRP